MNTHRKHPAPDSYRKVKPKVTLAPLQGLLNTVQWRQLSDALYDFGQPNELHSNDSIRAVGRKFWHFFQLLKTFGDYSWLQQNCVHNHLKPTELIRIKILQDQTMDLELLLIPGDNPAPLIDYQGQTGLYLCLSGALCVGQYEDQQVAISRTFAISKLRRMRTLTMQSHDLLPIERYFGNIHELEAVADCATVLRIRLQCEQIPRYWMYPITPKRLDQDDFFVRRLRRYD